MFYQLVFLNYYYELGTMSPSSRKFKACSAHRAISEPIPSLDRFWIVATTDAFAGCEIKVFHSLNLLLDNSFDVFAVRLNFAYYLIHLQDILLFMFD